MKLLKKIYKRAIIKSCYERTITKESHYNQNGQKRYNHF
jgi:hypothetical protein